MVCVRSRDPDCFQKFKTECGFKRSRIAKNLFAHADEMKTGDIDSNDLAIEIPSVEEPPKPDPGGASELVFKCQCPVRLCTF